MRFGWLLLVAIAGCASPSEEEIATTSAPLKFADVTPLTQVYVKGKGAIDVEGDYLPKVVCCENSGAHPEALKAQAVMARTYMYFRYFGENLGTSDRPFTGTTADQAYFCNNAASAACKGAVLATRNQITTFDDGGVTMSNVSFFIDGPRPACISKKSCKCAKPSTTTSMTPDDHAECDCFTFSSQGAANPAYVTYNWSRSGDDVAGSSIGNPSHESNRGCASQNIQSCLGYAGWSYHDMLRFFYGQDIELRTADGALAEPAGPGDPTDPSSLGGDRLRSSDASESGCSATPGASSGSWFLVAVVAACGVRNRRLRRHST